MVPLIKMPPNHRLEDANYFLRELLASCSITKRSAVIRNGRKQVRGIALLAAESAALEISEYSPRLIKQTVAGYGNAEKRQVQEMVRVLLSLTSVPEPHDAADALAVAICHFHHAGVQRRLVAAEARTKVNPTVAVATRRRA